MSDHVTKLFDFALGNPDYWKLLRQDDEPAEVSEMDQNRRAAFNAARSEVQRLCQSLLTEIHEALKKKAKGSDLEDVFNKRINQPSFRAGQLYFQLLDGKGKLSWLFVNLERGDVERIVAYVSVYTAAKRFGKLIEAFRDKVKAGTVHEDGEYIYVEDALAKDRAFNDIATSLVEPIWSGVMAFVELMDGEAAANDGTESEDDDE